MESSTVESTDKPASNHGGKRPGAGRRPKTEQNDAHTLLAKAKAKHETYKAQLAELEYKRQIGELITVAEVEETAGIAFAAVAQTLLSLSDNLERQGGITAEQAEIVDTVAHDALSDLSARMSKIAPNFEP